MRIGFACWLLTVLAGQIALGQDSAPKLPGIVVDNGAAEVSGVWTDSKVMRPFLGEGYIYVKAPVPGAAVKYSPTIPVGGKYHVLLLFCASASREKEVDVAIDTDDGTQSVVLDQSKPGTGPYGFTDLGEYGLLEGKINVVISGAKGKGHVIADALWIATPEELAAAEKEAKSAKPPTVAAKKPDPKKPAEKPPEPPPIPEVAFVRAAPQQPLAPLTAAKLDALMEQHVGGVHAAPAVEDAIFLRRVSLDLAGRQPTLAELEMFAADTMPDRRVRAVDRLLALPEVGRNWGHYFSDTMAYRMQEPELTFHDYKPLRAWLADQFNAGVGWDEISFRLLTAGGAVGKNPAATFIGFHQAGANKLAGETSRVFLGVQIHCAECHDHPFIDMKQTTFHGMAAFFVRANAKIPQNNSHLIEVTSKDKGEQAIEGKKGEVPPAFYKGERLELGLDDMGRRTKLATWLVGPENRWFAKAFVNRVWHRMMGSGFRVPIDNIDEEAEIRLPEVHRAVAEHFIASGYDLKSLLRLIATTHAYERPLGDTKDKPFGAAVAKKLRGDEVYDSLATAIGLPNTTPPQEKATTAVRFPPPPKSTRDLVNEAFGYDPSTPDDQVLRTLKQAMLLMNNTQIQKQVAASEESGTLLAKLLADEKDDSAITDRLYLALFAHKPNEAERAKVLKHVGQAPSRGAGFEDVLWGLINSAEFLTRP